MAVYHNNRRVQRFRLLEEAPIKIPLGASGSSGTGGDNIYKAEHSDHQGAKIQIYECRFERRIL